ncbi:10083_t:CDS:1, partial [Cetraspora pellucida]
GINRHIQSLLESLNKLENIKIEREDPDSITEEDKDNNKESAN